MLSFWITGPYDMYRYPGCNSMVVGWLTEDPVLIGERWHRPRDKFPLPSSEITRFVSEQFKFVKPEHNLFVLF